MCQSLAVLCLLLSDSHQTVVLVIITIIVNHCVCYTIDIFTPFLEYISGRISSTAKLSKVHWSLVQEDNEPNRCNYWHLSLFWIYMSKIYVSNCLHHIIIDWCSRAGSTQEGNFNFWDNRYFYLLSVNFAVMSDIISSNFCWAKEINGVI